MIAIPDRAAAPPILVRDLRRSFSSGRGRNRFTVDALDGVSLTVEAGRCLAVVGESGSGKSTLARIVVGLERADSGTVELLGRPVTARANRAERHRRARDVQMVFQDPQGALNRRLPVRAAVEEVIRAHLSLSAGQRALRCAELFERVGLSPALLEAAPAELSGGQRQRVAIARALAAGASILVLDEAVAALDVSVQAQVLNLLSELKRSEGLSFLFISHDLSVVRQMADDIVVMRQGRIVEIGLAAAVIDEPRHPYTRLLRDCVPRPGWVPRRSLVESTALEAQA